MTDVNHEASEPTFEPQPGSGALPPWTVGELPEPPTFRWSNIALMLGPGLVMGAAAIGGGEWLTGPLVTARYGGALLWLATLSIVFQVIYNVEISRYTLYTGEPIFTGKFRLPPSPLFWLMAYLFLDLGSILPYLAANAAIPMFGIVKGHLPDPKEAADQTTLLRYACFLFVIVFVPLCVGGKVYNSIKAVMAVKLIVVLGFLLFLAVFFSRPATWYELGRGFVMFGTIPVVAEGDTNGNGIREADEGPHGSNTENLFTGILQGKHLMLDLSMIGILASMAAISGNGGLTNTPISSYTRDQGWGMGRHVGAIPSMVGGHAIELSHSGKVFRVTREALGRWHGWVAHVAREQYVVWLPACFIGLALPSMLSIVFLPRGMVLKDKWQAAGMTADGVRDGVGRLFDWPLVGQIFWYLTLFCGLLVLGTSLAATADGVLRRWVDVMWTALPSLQNWEPHRIRGLYFGVLCIYVVFGLLVLTLVQKGDILLVYSTMMYNYALGVSCWHTLIVNRTLLPRELHPRWWQQTGLILGGLFFLTIGVLTTYAEGHKLVQPLQEWLSPSGNVRP